MKYYLRLMRLHLPVSIFLPLWPALWALCLASNAIPKMHFIIIFIVGNLLARSAGCVINDYADRHIDKHVTRTRERPLTSKKISATSALYLFVLLGLAALALTLLLNRMTFLIALASALLVTLYPLAKRVTHLPQVLLGIVYNSGVLMAYSAVQSRLPPIAWILFLSLILWTIAYDTMYAIADREDDKKIGVKSTAILFGKHDRLIIALLQSAFFILLLWIGLHTQQSVGFYTAYIIACVISLYQQHLLKNHEPLACLRAFRASQHIGWVILLGIVLDLLFKLQ